jgi:hypothetical protein
MADALHHIAFEFKRPISNDTLPSAARMLRADGQEVAPYRPGVSTPFPQAAAVM